MLTEKGARAGECNSNSVSTWGGECLMGAAQLLVPRIRLCVESPLCDKIVEVEVGLGTRDSGRPTLHGQLTKDRSYEATVAWAGDWP